MKRSRTLVVTAATAALLAAGGLTATSAVAASAPAAVSAAPSASPSSPSPTAHPGRIARVLLRDLLRHGGAVGKVTSVSDSSLTVTGAKGKTRTYDLTATTTVHLDHGRRDRAVGKVSDVSVGERVIVRATKASDSGTRDAASIDVLLGRAAAHPAGGATSGS